MTTVLLTVDIPSIMSSLLCKGSGDGGGLKTPDHHLTTHHPFLPMFLTHRIHTHTHTDYTLSQAHLCIPPRARSGYTVRSHTHIYILTQKHTHTYTEIHIYGVYGESQDQLGKRDLCIKQLVASKFFHTQKNQ